MMKKNILLFVFLAVVSPKASFAMDNAANLKRLVNAAITGKTSADELNFFGSGEVANETGMRKNLIEGSKRGGEINPLWAAVLSNNPETVKALFEFHPHIKEGVNHPLTNSREQKITILMQAADSNLSPEIINFLIEKLGADVSIKNEDGATALEFAPDGSEIQKILQAALDKKQADQPREPRPVPLAEPAPAGEEVAAPEEEEEEEEEVIIEDEPEAGEEGQEGEGEPAEGEEPAGAEEVVRPEPEKEWEEIIAPPVVEPQEPAVEEPEEEEEEEVVEEVEEVEEEEGAPKPEPDQPSHPHGPGLDYACKQGAIRNAYNGNLQAVKESFRCIIPAEYFSPSEHRIAGQESSLNLLSAAVVGGKKDIVKFLLEDRTVKNKINEPNEDGLTPLLYAQITGNDELAGLLKAKGGEDADVMDILYRAIDNGKPEITKMIAGSEKISLPAEAIQDVLEKAKIKARAEPNPGKKAKKTEIVKILEERLKKPQPQPKPEQEPKPQDGPQPQNNQDLLASLSTLAEKLNGLSGHLGAKK